ncbi:NB-ARC domain-containing protein [Streptomyces sp. NPDC053086]|uniref:DUF7779 domain-containing protein n=1 Tax=unclassified Streptomyces TaxID=2593676 RepID=UPI0037D794EA
MSAPLQQPPAGVGGDHVDFHDSVFTGPVVGKQHIHHHPPRPPASWPHQVGTLPAAAGFFQERGEAGRLRDALTVGGEAVLVGQGTAHGQVLAGMGGVGKTQLAADYARTLWQTGRLDVLVWITADTSTAVVTGYAQAAAELLGTDPADPVGAARAFLAWLEPKAQGVSCRWLIVLDDITDPADMRGWWPPASPHGRTLVTTRRQDAALTSHGRRMIPVGLFTRTESLAYLTAALDAQDRHEDTGQLLGLAEDLGHLPLALSQAAAYLIDTGLAVSTYRSLLADRTRTLADAAPEALPDDQSHPLDAAWSLSIDRANALRPVGLARPLLQIAAFLDPNGIPETVLTSRRVLDHLTAGTGTDPRPASVSAEQAQQALGALRRLSLVDRTTRDTGHSVVRIHQLIQHAVRDTLTTSQYDRTARTAADALLAVWPDIERDTALAQTLRSNTAALTRYAQRALYRPDAHGVLYRAGRSLGEAGQVTAARDYFQRFTDTATAYLGADHPDTLTVRGYLARWRGEAGEAAGAATAFTGLLVDLTRVLGPDHPDTLTVRSYLAQWRGKAGDAAGAAAAFAELLEDMTRVRHADDPDVHTVRSYLARWRGEAGDAAGAATAFAELLDDLVRVRHADDPAVLIARGHLAQWRAEAGDAAGAATATVELLDNLERVLGPDHPDTLTAREHLALWRGEAGDPVGAVTALTELLDDMTRVLGPDHPHTLTARGNLALWRGTAGDPVGAATALAELLDDMRRILRPDHPDILIARGNLARWQAHAGDPAGAATALTELLNDLVRILGPDHPNTLAARTNLADAQGRAGDAAGAATTLAELLDDLIRVRGRHHPSILATRSSLAHWRGEAGDAAGAAAAIAELLEERRRVFGPDHLRTLIARNNLAYWQQMARKGDRAGG